MDPDGRIVVGRASAELRRTLRPIEWVVLEEVALDARRDGAGALVAATSARRVAEHLALTPGTVARALARLGAAGVLTHTRQPGPAGRFGLSAYVLGPVPGLEVVAVAEPPGSAGPHPAPPPVDRPRAADGHMARAPASSQGAESARRALHDDVVAALASAVEEVVSEDGARSAGARSPTRRVRRAPTPDVAQLSILDISEDSALDTNAERHR